MAGEVLDDQACNSERLEGSTTMCKGRMLLKIRHNFIFIGVVDFKTLL
jgi:hypothetical protein